jgi:hypothetical protein
MSIGILRRELIINWDEAHQSLRVAEEQRIHDPRELLEAGKGWSYVTFFRRGTAPGSVLYDIDAVERLARENGYFLPGEVVAQHNKLVVTATSDEHGSAGQILGLLRLLHAFADKYGDTKKYPRHGFYGKLGGVYDRPEKGRVLALYSTGDEELLEIAYAFEQLQSAVKTRGIRLEQRLANGLSDIPRMLDGFGKPTYHRSGADSFRITDPVQFTRLLEQARRDYANYAFGQIADRRARNGRV